MTSFRPVRERAKAGITCPSRSLKCAAARSIIEPHDPARIDRLSLVRPVTTLACSDPARWRYLAGSRARAVSLRIWGGRSSVADPVRQDQAPFPLRSTRRSAPRAHLPGGGHASAPRPRAMPLSRAHCTVTDPPTRPARHPDNTSLQKAIAAPAPSSVGTSGSQRLLAGHPPRQQHRLHLIRPTILFTATPSSSRRLCRYEGIALMISPP